MSPQHDNDNHDLRSGTGQLSTGVRMHYYVAGPVDGRPLVLLHGWPHTAWQFRLALPLFAAAGYRAVAPDYRGAGSTSRPMAGYDKWTMAEDVHELLHAHLGVPSPVTVLGHDIGSMVAAAYAFRYRNDVRALIWGEAPQPGTAAYDSIAGNPLVFHFALHAVPDLPETLVTGREYEYFRFFVDSISYAPDLVDVKHTAEEFRVPGALRAGFELYRSFDQDARDLRRALAGGGKLTVPVLGTVGAVSPATAFIESMTAEIAEDPHTAIVPEAGHWMAEENPEGLVAAVLAFLGGAREKEDEGRPGS